MKKLLYILLLLPLFPLRCEAQDLEEETARQTGIYQVETALDSEEREISGNLLLNGEYDAQGALVRLWNSFLMTVKQNIKSELGFAAKLVLIALCCSLCSALSPGSRQTPWMELVCCCAGTLLLAGSMDSVFRQAEETLQRLYDYGIAAFPAFYTTVAACGASASAAVRYAAVQFAADVFMDAARSWILPLLEAYLSVSICSALFDNAMLHAAARLCRWCAVTAMSLLSAGFCASIGFSGIVSGSADAAAVKTAKTVISSTLPVVGNILSDSASSLLAAASLIKNSAGIFCLIAVCAICAGPFALLAVKLLVFKAAAAVSSLGGSERYTRLLSGFGSVFAMLLGLVGCFGFMLFFSFLSGVRMVSAA